MDPILKLDQTLSELLPILRGQGEEITKLQQQFRQCALHICQVDMVLKEIAGEDTYAEAKAELTKKAQGINPKDDRIDHLEQTVAALIEANSAKDVEIEELRHHMRHFVVLPDEVDYESTEDEPVKPVVGTVPVIESETQEPVGENE